MPVAALWPHPDDEAYLSTGLMGRMTDAGHDVTVLTVTSGEKGTSDPADFGQPHFARQREEELRDCVRASHAALQCTQKAKPPDTIDAEHADNKKRHRCNTRVR